MAQHERDTDRGWAGGRIAVLDWDPELAEDLPEPQRELARRQVLAEVVAYPAGPWEVGPDDFDRASSFGLLIVEGLMAREVTVGDYTCAELLGPGDLIQPWLRIGQEESVATEIDWDVRCAATFGHRCAATFGHHCAQTTG